MTFQEELTKILSDHPHDISVAEMVSIIEDLVSVYYTEKQLKIRPSNLWTKLFYDSKI